MTGWCEYKQENVNKIFCLNLLSCKSTVNGAGLNETDYDCMNLYYFTQYKLHHMSRGLSDNSIRERYTGVSRA